MLFMAGFTFLSYGNPTLGNSVTTQPPENGPIVVTPISCPVPSNGLTTTCSAANGNTQGTEVSASQTKSFTFTQSITVGVSILLFEFSLSLIQAIAS